MTKQYTPAQENFLLDCAARMMQTASHYDKQVAEYYKKKDVPEWVKTEGGLMGLYSFEAAKAMLKAAQEEGLLLDEEEKEYVNKEANKTLCDHNLVISPFDGYTRRCTKCKFISSNK